jgi:hypothetical protein
VPFGNSARLADVEAQRPTNQLDEAGNRAYRPATAYAMPRVCRGAAVPPLSTRFPATEYVASLAMVRGAPPLAAGGEPGITSP